MALWMVLIILIGALLMTGIERLLRRLGVHRVEPEEASGGFRDVLTRLERATAEHQASRDQNQQRREQP